MNSNYLDKEFKNKYLKYKQKYLGLKSLIGGVNIDDEIYDAKNGSYLGWVHTMTPMSINLKTPARSKLTLLRSDEGIKWVVKTAQQGLEASIAQLKLDFEEAGTLLEIRAAQLKEHKDIMKQSAARFDNLKPEEKTKRRVERESEIRRETTILEEKTDLDKESQANFTRLQSKLARSLSNIKEKIKQKAQEEKDNLLLGLYEASKLEKAPSGPSEEYLQFMANNAAEEAKDAAREREYAQEQRQREEAAKRMKEEAEAELARTMSEQAQRKIQREAAQKQRYEAHRQREAAQRQRDEAVPTAERVLRDNLKEAIRDRQLSEKTYTDFKRIMKVIFPSSQAVDQLMVKKLREMESTLKVYKTDLDSKKFNEELNKLKLEKHLRYVKGIASESSQAATMREMNSQLEQISVIHRDIYRTLEISKSCSAIIFFRDYDDYQIFCQLFKITPEFEKAANSTTFQSKLPQLIQVIASLPSLKSIGVYEIRIKVPRSVGIIYFSNYEEYISVFKSLVEAEFLEEGTTPLSKF